MNRTLPWHDTPKCKEPGCNGRVVFDAELGVSPMCGACGTTFRATPEERAQLQCAEDAWNLVLEGKIHEDRGCARCGGVLPIEQQRLCPPCARADSEERTLPLFA